MRSSEARLIAILIGFVAGTLAVAAFLLGNQRTFSHFSWFIFFVFAAVFVLVFLAVYFSFRSFIRRKITPLYQILYNTMYSEPAPTDSFVKKEMLGQVSQDVINWVVSRNREITRLKEMEKYRREFLGNVSHELKTPIFNIQGYVLTLLDGGLEDPSINRLYLEKTEKSINRMISIVEDLETIARLESGEAEMHFEVFNFIKLVEEVFEMQEERARKRNITLQMNRKYERPVKVYADRKRIYEVMNNLIINSINYGNDGGSTTVSCLDIGDTILVEVSDTGIGIEAEHLPRIFERFYRIDKSRSRDFGGTGLGLAIVKHILEAHGQKISVRSTPGKGSVFSFTLRKG